MQRYTRISEYTYVIAVQMQNLHFRDRNTDSKKFQGKEQLTAYAHLHQHLGSKEF